MRIWIARLWRVGSGTGTSRWKHRPNLRQSHKDPMARLGRARRPTPAGRPLLPPETHYPVYSRSMNRTPARAPMASARTARTPIATQTQAGLALRVSYETPLESVSRCARSECGAILIVLAHGVGAVAALPRSKIQLALIISRRRAAETAAEALFLGEGCPIFLREDLVIFSRSHGPPPFQNPGRCVRQSVMAIRNLQAPRTSPKRTQRRWATRRRTSLASRAA